MKYKSYLIVIVFALFSTLATGVFLANNRQSLSKLASVDETYAAVLDPNCADKVVPVGALPGQPFPLWCYSELGKTPQTAIIGANSWVDDFNSGVMLSECCTGYTIYDDLQRTQGKTAYWSHNNHWMIDSQNTNSMMRPNKSFRFENGKLVIEADVAASVEGYNELVWPEIDITTAPAPTSSRRDALYGYDEFSGHYTLGCRLHGNDRHVICAFFGNNNLGSTNGGRVFEISFFQHEGAQVFGGGPWGAGEKAWSVCKGTDPDTMCRNRFRWEITKTSSTMYVNGVKYMEHVGIPPLPDAFVNSDIYVYLSTWNGLPSDKIARFHWDRIAVNPSNLASTPEPMNHSMPPTPAGSVMSSTPTPRPIVTATPAITSTPLSSPTPSITSSQSSVLKIYAAGQQAQNVYPTLDVRVNNNGSYQSVKRFTNINGDAAKGEFKTYTYTSPSKLSVDKLRIHFINDLYLPSLNQDRNVRIQKIELDGITYTTVSPSTYSLGSWNSTTGCAGGYKQSEWLMCNGYFSFK